MSLINEALKKAQKDGSGKDAPAARSPDVTSATLNGRKPGAAMIAVGVVAILAVAGGAGYYFTQSDAKPEADPLTPVKKAEVNPVAEPRVVAKTVETPVAPTVPIPGPIKPTAEIPASSETVKPAEPAAVKPAETPVTPVVPVTPVTPQAPVQNSEITEMIGRMKVSFGRKKTGRCVIDSVMFKVGDQLSPSPVINIKAVTDNEVVFSDVNGVEYAKKYK